jgi:hypothetical protein
MKTLVATVLCALLLTGPALAACNNDSCRSIARILGARSNNFSDLKGKPLDKDTGGNQKWEGMEKPLGLTCIINEGAVHYYAPGYSYSCAKEGITEPEAKKLYNTLTAVSRAAAPDLKWHSQTDFSGGELSGGASESEYIVDIQFASLGMVVLTVNVKPVTRK